MTDARQRIVADFSRDLSRRVEEVMQRQVDLGQAVLTGPEIAEVMLNVAVNVNLATILVLIQQKSDDITAEALFDLTAQSIAHAVAGNRAKLGRAIELMEARRSAGRRA